MATKPTTKAVAKKAPTKKPTAKKTPAKAPVKAPAKKAAPRKRASKPAAPQPPAQLLEPGEWYPGQRLEKMPDPETPEEIKARTELLKAYDKERRDADVRALQESLGDRMKSVSWWKTLAIGALIAIVVFLLGLGAAWMALH